MTNPFKKVNSVVNIDSREKRIRIMTVSATGEYNAESFQFKENPYSEDFYIEFAAILNNFTEVHHQGEPLNAVLVLPDNLFFTNTIVLPSIKGKSVRGTINSTYAGFYSNLKDLKIVDRISKQSRQSLSVCLTGTRDEHISAFKKSFSAAKCSLSNITFESEAINCSLLDPAVKTKGNAYVLLDIKEKSSKIIYSIEGAVCGYASLPFGSEIIVSNKLAAEDMLFNHPVAELAVLNANEKAKAKMLTVMDSGGVDVNEISDNPDENSGEGNTSGDSLTEKQADSITQSAPVIKVLPKKTPRKLPKFMLRPVPETNEGIACENFRLFVKWVLCYIDSNEKLRTIGTPENVYVNMPAGYDYVLESVNAEAEENGVKFIYSGLETKSPSISGNPELYGGLLLGKSKTYNKF